MREVTRLLLRYRVALSVTLVALLITFLLPARSERLPFALFIGAVVISAWHGGIRPGLLTTVLAGAVLMSKWLLIRPADGTGLDPDFPPRLVMFLVIGVLASYLSRLCRRAIDEVEWTNAAFGSIADGVIFTDEEGHVTFLNPTAQLLTGWAQDDAEGLPLEQVYQVVDDDSNRPAESAAARALQTGDIVHPPGRVALVPRKGPSVLIEQRASPLRDPTGNLAGAVLLFRDVSLHEQAERDLRQSEEQFRALAACAPVGVLLMGPDGRCTYTNPACQALCGLTYEEGLGEGWVRAIHPEDRDRLATEAVVAARDGKEYAGTFRWQPTLGTLRWLELRSTPIRPEPDRRLGQVVTLRDVSDLVASRQEVRDFEDQLQTAWDERERSESSLKEVQGRLQAVLTEHQRAEQALREAGPALQTARAEGQRARDALKESQSRLEATATERDRLAKALREGEPALREALAAKQQAEEAREAALDEQEHGAQALRELEARLAAADAERRLALEQAEKAREIARKEFDGRLESATAELARANARLQEQIEERERAAQSLRDNQTRMQALFDNLPAALSLKDADGRYLLVNRAFKRLFQLNKKQVVERTDADIFPKELAEVLQANDRKVLAARTELECEETVPQERTPRHYFSLRAPLYDAAGRTTGICSVAIDLTERKGIEEALRRDKEAAETLLQEHASRAETQAGEQGQAVESWKQSAAQAQRLADECRTAAEQFRRKYRFARALADSLTEGLCAVDRAGMLTFLNPAAERLLGCREVDVRGRRSLTQMMALQSGSLADHLNAAMTTGIAVHEPDQVLADHNGYVLPVAYTAAPLVAEEQIEGALVLVRERSEGAQRQEALAEIDAGPVTVEPAGRSLPVALGALDWLSYN